MYLSTPHAHTTYVDGKSTPREMIEAALRKGFSSLGFSEHATEAREPAFGLTAESEAAYIREIRALAAEYAGRIRIRLGMERDAVSRTDRSKYEYVIGSAHYVACEGGYAVVDGDPSALAEDIRRHFSGDGMAFARAYYETLSGYVAAYGPEIIGHFDLLRKWNARLRMFDSGSRAYRRITSEALETMRPCDALLEVNTGAIARGYLTDPYPEAFELACWREMGGRATIGTDCHRAEALDCGMDAARARLLEAGYSTFWALGPGETLFAEYEL